METKQNGMSVRKGKRKGDRAKWERAVSRKFYESVCRQIRDVSALSDDIDAANVIACLDEYIDRGQAQPDFSEMETVVFTLLQPQIDKALQRSRRARAAAARRRKANVQAMQEEKANGQAMSEEVVVTRDESTANASVQAVSEDSPELEAEKANPSASPRDEKRALRREAAMARRLLKRQKRLARRTTKNQDNSVAPSQIVG